MAERGVDGVDAGAGEAREGGLKDDFLSEGSGRALSAGEDGFVFGASDATICTVDLVALRFIEDITTKLDDSEGELALVLEVSVKPANALPGALYSCKKSGPVFGGRIVRYGRETLKGSCTAVGISPK